MPPIVYFIALVIATAIALHLATYVMKQRTQPGAQPIVALMLAVAFWTSGYALELVSADLESKLFWAKVEYIGIATLAPLWLYFVVHTVAPNQTSILRQRRIQILIIIVPLLTLVLAWTNEAHGFIWQSVELDVTGSFPNLALRYGPWFWVHAGYSYLLIALGTIWAVITLWNPRRIYRYQSASVLLGMLPVWASNIAYLQGRTPIPYLDLTPFAFTVAGIIYTLAIYRFRLLDIMPIAYKAVFKELNDSIIVLDHKGRIIDLNPTAQQLIRQPADTLIGQPLSALFGSKAWHLASDQQFLVHEWMRQVTCNPQGGDANGKPADAQRYLTPEFKITVDETPQTYDVQCVPFLQSKKGPCGGLLILHNITDRKKAEQALQALNMALEQRVVKRTRALECEIAERAQIEQALRTSELRHQAILNAIPDLILLFDADGTCLASKPSDLRLYRFDTLPVGKTIVEIFPQDIGCQIQHAMVCAGQTQEVEHHTFQQRIQGVERWFEARIVTNPATESAVIIRDITAERSAEAHIHYQAGLLDNVSDAVISIDSAFRILSWNKAAQQIYGYAPEEALGKYLPDLLQTEYINDASSDVLKQFTQTGSWRGEVRQHKKNGAAIDIETSVAAICDEADQPIGAVAVNRDVTAYKQATRALVQAELRYQTLFDEAPVMYVIARFRGTIPMIVGCNELFARTLGHTKDDVIGRPLSDFYPENLRHQYILDGLRRPSNDNPQVRERILVARDGRILETQLHMRQELSAQGEVIGMHATYVDISQRKRSEEQLNETTQRLRNLAQHIESVREKERARIAREIHDELGQMLTALKIDLGWLGNRLPKNNIELSNKVASMSQLVSSTIKTVGRISADLRPGLLDRLGLSAAIQWQLAEFEARTEITCQMLGDVEEEIDLEPALATALFRILQEALVNVARHARATLVTVRLDHTPNSVCLTVQDNGVGIELQEIRNPHSFGLIGMRERLYPWRGQLEIEGTHDQGTRVSALVMLSTSPGEVQDD